MKPEEIAQWVIDNRYPKSEYEKVSDSEMYHEIIAMIKGLDDVGIDVLPKKKLNG